MPAPAIGSEFAPSCSRRMFTQQQAERPVQVTVTHLGPLQAFHRVSSLGSALMGLWRRAFQKRLLFSHACSGDRLVVLCPERATLHCWSFTRMGREDGEISDFEAIQIPALQLSCCVTLGKPLNFSLLPFPHL